MADRDRIAAALANKVENIDRRGVDMTSSTSPMFKFWHTEVLPVLDVPIPVTEMRPYESSPYSNFVKGTCRQRSSWSFAGHNHRKVIGRDHICAS